MSEQKKPTTPSPLDDPKLVRLAFVELTKRIPLASRNSYDEKIVGRRYGADGKPIDVTGCDVYWHPERGYFVAQVFNNGQPNGAVKYITQSIAAFWEPA